MHRRFQGSVLLTMLLLTQVSLADLYDAEREQFLKAESALRAGHSKTFSQLKQELIDYPLYGYLEYSQLRRRLGAAKADDVQIFLDKYAGQPIAIRLRISWLHKLGKRRDWDNYLQFYQPQTSITLQCYDVRARLTKGDRQQALEDTMQLWLVGDSRPDACDPAFDQLYATSLMTSARIWERVRLAFANQKSSLALYLAKRLSADDREWVKRWHYARRRPTSALSKPWAKQDTPLVREILVYALRRLARHKPEQAWKHWQKATESHRFNTQQAGSVLQKIALHGALRNHPQATLWLEAVPAAAINSDIRKWRVRTALGNEDWKGVLRWIDELTPTERQSDNWRYWRAYALDATGEAGDAFTGYARLSGERSYYGFLAADKLQRPYQMNDSRLEYQTSQLETVERIPGIVRARELYLAGKHTKARREWFHTTGSLQQGQLKLAALLAHRWGWHDRAILTASRASYWSDLALRFPLPHRESIFTYARQYDLDPALIYGVIRQESAFMEDARSPVGALGLMQLMPNTGRQTARALNIRYRGSQALLHSDKNIRLGSAYLNKLLQRYNGSPVLAAAAYNAGPHRVSRWLPTNRSIPASLWAERIPYRETRTYVRRVLAYSTVFEWRLQRPVTRLSQRMPAIQQRY